MRVNSNKKVKDEGRSLRRRARLEGLDFDRDYSDVTGDGCTQRFPGSKYNAEEIELIKAMDLYQHTNNRKFPAFTEVLAVLKSLGWRKVAEAGPLPAFPLEREEGE